jgi:hypothetical protein
LATGEQKDETEDSQQILNEHELEKQPLEKQLLDKQ